MVLAASFTSPFRKSGLQGSVCFSLKKSHETKQKPTMEYSALQK